MGSGVGLHVFLICTTWSWRGCQVHALPLYTRVNISRYLLVRVLGGPQNWSGCWVGPRTGPGVGWTPELVRVLGWPQNWSGCWVGPRTGPGVGWAPELLPSRWRAEKFRSPISGSFMLFGSEVNYCACAVESKIQNACFVTSARYSAARVGGRLSEWTALAGSADR